MASKELIKAINEYEAYVNQKGITDEIIDAYIMAEQVCIVTEKDYETGYKIGKHIRELIDKYLTQVTGGNFATVEEWAYTNKQKVELIDKWYKTLLLEAPHILDSYCLYIERYRERKARFYEPRRKTMLKIVDKLQALEDDKLDRLFIHLPPRVGKSTLMTFYACWHIARDTEASNLYATYKESLGGAFLQGVKEVLTDPTYCHVDVFPDAPIVATDAKNNKLDLKRVKKYKSLSGKGLESGLNGEYDATGVMIIDDIIEGIQDVLNPETLTRKKIVFDNNLMSRSKEKCKIIYNGTIWSLHDIYMGVKGFLENNPEAKSIRWDIVKIPALDPDTDESNFDYDYNVGFSTQHFKTIRAKFEENDDLASWHAQYQQEPIERDGAVFNPEHMRFYNGELPNEKPYRICAACDVALGGADYLALAVAYLYEDGSVYIDDVVFDNAEKKVTKPKVVNMLIDHNVGSAFFEANQGGEGYKDEVDADLRKKGIKINLRSEYAPTDRRKGQRIWDKAGSIREYYFRDVGCRSNEYRKFMTNLYSFTVTGKNKHEDAADCMASLAHFIENSGVSARIEPIFNPFRNMGGYNARW